MRPQFFGKPIKTNKVYYFKNKTMSNQLEKNAINHNDIEEKDRGVWRKYNPYNPWVEDKTEQKAQDLKVESLDDLFEETDNTTKKEEKNDIKNEVTNKPIQEEDSYDLQKELEAKFDELFGPLEDDD